jgi:pterin-4a-carbinolamine dehydratase
LRPKNPQGTSWKPAACTGIAKRCLETLEGWGNQRQQWGVPIWKHESVSHRVADIAEAEGHHPDIAIHWNRVDLTLWTHKIGGLHENDFILAAKIDKLLEEPKGQEIG